MSLRFPGEVRARRREIGTEIEVMKDGYRSDASITGIGADGGSKQLVSLRNSVVHGTVLDAGSGDATVLAVGGDGVRVMRVAHSPCRRA